ncbi:hypothetical protein [Halovulum sp. GXIMD14793]
MRFLTIILACLAVPSSVVSQTAYERVGNCGFRVAEVHPSSGFIDPIVAADGTFVLVGFSHRDDDWFGSIAITHGNCPQDITYPSFNQLKVFGSSSEFQEQFEVALATAEAFLKGEDHADTEVLRTVFHKLGYRNSGIQQKGRASALWSAQCACANAGFKLPAFTGNAPDFEDQQ